MLCVKNASIKGLYKSLYKQYGKQSWWPAEAPFEVMVGAILTQNTAWSNVEKAIANLRRAGVLEPLLLDEISQPELAELIRPSGYFNIKARRLKEFCCWFVARGGLEGLSKADTLALRNDLLAVHGIGPETADDILLYAFKRPVFVIDTYTRRLFTRTGLATGEEKYDILRIMVEEALDCNVDDMNEFHGLIVKHAKEHCRVKPLCECCPVSLP